MNNELKEMLQSILKEALEPINQRLDKIEKTMATKDDIRRLENAIKDARVENLNSDNMILQKLDEIKSEVEFTYIKTSKNELEIHKLKKQ